MEAFKNNTSNINFERMNEIVNQKLQYMENRLKDRMNLVNQFDDSEDEEDSSFENELPQISEKALCLNSQLNSEHPNNENKGETQKVEMNVLPENPNQIVLARRQSIIKIAIQDSSLLTQKLRNLSSKKNVIGKLQEDKFIESNKMRAKNKVQLLFQKAVKSIIKEFNFSSIEFLNLRLQESKEELSKSFDEKLLKCEENQTKALNNHIASNHIRLNYMEEKLNHSEEEIKDLYIKWKDEIEERKKSKSDTMISFNNIKKSLNIYEAKIEFSVNYVTSVKQIINCLIDDIKLQHIMEFQDENDKETIALAGIKDVKEIYKENESRKKKIVTLNKECISCCREPSVS